MTSRHSTAALAIVLLPLGAYVAGYFWLGAAQVWYFSVPVDPLARGDLQAIHRTYSSQTLATIYQGGGKGRSLAARD